LNETAQVVWLSLPTERQTLVLLAEN
jgi:hypothetical protein